MLPSPAGGRPRQAAAPRWCRAMSRRGQVPAVRRGSGQGGGRREEPCGAGGAQGRSRGAENRAVRGWFRRGEASVPFGRCLSGEDRPAAGSGAGRLRHRQHPPARVPRSRPRRPAAIRIPPQRCNAHANLPGEPHASSSGCVLTRP